MSSRTLAVTDAIQQYLCDVTLREPPLLRRLREETAQRDDAEMQIAPEQGQFMALLVELLGARHCIEIGTFTGYSALCVALALPPEGRLICCDVSEAYTSVARRYWQAAGVAGKIELRLQPGIQSLDELLAAGQGGKFDFAFIDADKPAYDAYYERCLALLRPGGLIALDNMLSDGRVVNPQPDQTNARAIDALNRKLQHDERVTTSLVPIADGLMLARKR